MNATGLKKVGRGDVIFKTGDNGDCAYVIDSGRVQIYIEKDGLETPISFLGTGEIFGEMAILDRSPRAASAKALEETTLSVVSRQQFEQRITQADPIVRLLMSILLKRIRHNLHMAPKFPFSPQPEPETEQKQSKDDQEDQNKVIEKIKFEAELYEALKNNDFLLYFQPIHSLKTNKTHGFEALIRWNSPTRGLVRPDLFMGVAEETSLIIPIGRWVFDRACQSLAEFQKKIRNLGKNANDFFVSVNISGKQFSDTNFFTELESIPQKHSVRNRNLKLEITEKVLLEGSIFFFWVEKCRELGFPVSLDDFGTGYSVLSYLSEFNVDNIKIDQSFVRKLEQHDKTRVVVQAIVQIAKNIGIEVIAEGVENEKQVRLMRDLGCEYLQGFYFGKPMPYEEALKFLETHV